MYIPKFTLLTDEIVLWLCEIGKKQMANILGLIDMSDPSTNRFFVNCIIRPNYNKVYYDQNHWEAMLDDTTGIGWVCERPTNLPDNASAGKYHVKFKHCPSKGWKIWSILWLSRWTPTRFFVGNRDWHIKIKTNVNSVLKKQTT